MSEPTEFDTDSKFSGHPSMSVEAAQVLPVQSIPLDLLEPAPWNPMEDSQKNIDSLVANIRQNGFCETPLVILTDDGKYRILSGHDRTIAARIVGLKEIPCAIASGLTEEQQKFLTVRMNSIRKKLSPEKFLRLYQELSKAQSEELVRDQMMFTDTSVMDKALKSLKKQEKQAITEQQKTVDDLQVVVAELFNRCGAQLDRGYAIFSFGGVDHIYVAMSKELRAKIMQFADRSEVENKHISEIFEEALGITQEVKYPPSFSNGGLP